MTDLVWFSSVLALCVFAFADYIGYNIAADGGWKKLYRVLQLCFQLGLTVLLWVWVDYRAAFLFNFWWWCWIADLIYYLLFDSLRWFHRGYAGSAFANEVLGDKVRWAWWTPYGLVSRMLIPLGLRGAIEKQKPIAGDVLLVQAWVGAIVGMALVS